jgi:hypothetical protein
MYVEANSTQHVLLGSAYAVSYHTFVCIFCVCENIPTALLHRSQFHAHMLTATTCSPGLGCAYPCTYVYVYMCRSKFHAHEIWIHVLSCAVHTYMYVVHTYIHTYMYVYVHLCMHTSAFGHKAANSMLTCYSGPRSVRIIHTYMYHTYIYTYIWYT